MSDFELRSAQRRTHFGDVHDEARYLFAQVRRGTLSTDRLRVAAALGHPAAREAIGSTFLVPEPSPLRHWWRRKARDAFNALDRWAQETAGEADLLEAQQPYSGDLREWIEGLAPLGLATCVEVSRILLRQVAHDWPAVNDCLHLSRGLNEGETTAQAVAVAGDLAARASRVRDPEALRKAIRQGLVAWALAHEPAQAAPSAPEREAGEQGPVVKLANRMIEDAYSRGATRIFVEPRSETAMSVHYEVKGERSERMQIPLRAGPTLFARFKFMAGLDVTQAGVQQGAITFQRWSRKGLAIDLQIEFEPAGEGQRCVVVLWVPCEEPTATP